MAKPITWIVAESRSVVLCQCDTKSTSFPCQGSRNSQKAQTQISNIFGISKPHLISDALAYGKGKYDQTDLLAVSTSTMNSFLLAQEEIFRHNDKVSQTLHTDSWDVKSSLPTSEPK